MVPTVAATLGVRGHRPVVGTGDGKHPVYVFAVAHRATATVHANLVDSPTDAKKATGLGNTRRLQAAFAAPSGTSPGGTRRPLTSGWCC